MSISTLCMTANFHSGMWTGQRLDKEASRRVTKDAGAESDAANVNKHLVPKEALATIRTSDTAMRNHFYEHTLPWKDNGDRLLPRKMFQKFHEEHLMLRRVFDKEVDRFINNGYAMVLARAEFRMNELYNPNDYPKAEDLKRRFYAHVTYDSVTEAKDFRVKIEKDAADMLRAEIEQNVQDRVSKAMGNLWGQLYEVVGKFADKMSDEDARFHDTIIGNIVDVVNLIPSLNFLEDPNLEAMRQKVMNTLTGYDPKDLRKELDTRSDAAEQAQQIMDEMAGFMKAFGGAA